LKSFVLRDPAALRLAAMEAPSEMARYGKIALFKIREHGCSAKVVSRHAYCLQQLERLSIGMLNP